MKGKSIEEWANVEVEADARVHPSQLAAQAGKVTGSPRFKCEACGQQVTRGHACAALPPGL